MRILFFTQSTWSIPSITKLKEHHEILGVVTKTYGLKSSAPLLSFLKSQQIEALEWGAESSENLSAWVKENNIEIGLSFGFSYKIPKILFENFEHGVVNVHFGKLPQYSGPDPLFWAIKNQEKNVVITFHQISDALDAGTLILTKEVLIFPGEPNGLLGGRLANLVAQIVGSLVTQIVSQDKFTEIEENNLPKGKPTAEEIRIDWKTQSSDEVEALVNACNPNYGGAISMFRGSPIRILEVSPADLENQGVFSPGGIVYADVTYGIFVLCSDFKCLRINILQVEGAYITSQKFAALGVGVGEKFE